jgi:hypothetical protein
MNIGRMVIAIVFWVPWANCRIRLPWQSWAFYPPKRPKLNNFRAELKPSQRIIMLEKLWGCTGWWVVGDPPFNTIKLQPIWTARGLKEFQNSYLAKPLWKVLWVRTWDTARPEKFDCKNRKTYRCRQENNRRTLLKNKLDFRWEHFTNSTDMNSSVT